MDRDIYRDFARQIVLRDIGPEGQERLGEARVAVIGLGGLGSPAAMLLASMGVGFLRIVDRDIVSITDLHRQPLYRRSDVDRPKVEVASERLREINPWLEVDAVPAPLTNDNVDEVVSDVDVVLDGLDSMRARYILNRAIVRHRKPYVFASAIEVYGNLMTIIPYETPCLECFYGGLDDAGLPTCAEVGVHPSITHVVAGLSVAEASKIIAGHEPALKGKLLYIDIRSMSMDQIKIVRNESCPVCGDKPVGKPKPVELEPIEVSCARDGTGIIFINNLVEGLDRDSLVERIKAGGFKVDRVSGMAVSFKIDDNLSGVILTSGVMVGKARLYTDKVNEKLMEVYKSIVSDRD